MTRFNLVLYSTNTTVVFVLLFLMLLPYGHRNGTPMLRLCSSTFAAIGNSLIVTFPGWVNKPETTLLLVCAHLRPRLSSATTTESSLRRGVTLRPLSNLCSTSSGANTSTPTAGKCGGGISYFGAPAGVCVCVCVKTSHAFIYPCHRLCNAELNYLSLKRRMSSR